MCYREAGGGDLPLAAGFFACPPVPLLQARSGCARCAREWATRESWNGGWMDVMDGFYGWGTGCM